MDIEKIAAKLRPLMPEKISQWMKARELADPELKSLIEKQIISTAYKTFGDFHNKILLSLPPENKSNGPINLGTILYDKEKWQLGITKSELLNGTIITGRSGAGKTNTSFHVIQQLADKGIKFLYLDWKMTARHMLPLLNTKVNVYTPGRSLLKMPFNPFIVPPDMENNVYAGQVIDVMSQAFTLGDGSKSMIRKALLNLYEANNLCPTVKEIIVELDKIPVKDRMHGWKITAMRALESLEFSDILSNNKISQQNLAEKLLNENTIIELDALSGETKKFIVPILLLWVYSVSLKSFERENLKLAIVIEEGHHFLHKRQQTANETIFEMLCRQVRELGLCFILVDQHCHLLSSAAIGNSYTSIFLNQKDPSDINMAAAICQLDSNDKEYLSRLEVGCAVVKLQGRHTQPVMIQFPLVNIKKGSVTDAMLARYSALNQAGTASFNSRTPEPTYFGQVPQVPLLYDPLNDSSLRFLDDILNYPDDGVKARYQRLGFSIGTGSRLKDKLIKQNWLQAQQSVESDGTHKILLSLTADAKKALRLDDNSISGKESMSHRYWKSYHFQRLKEQGYQVTFEVPRISGSVDVVAQKDNQKIAIEIETGKSDFLRNIRQDLAAKYDKLLIIATDKNALEKIEKSIAKEGLLIPQVRIELACIFRTYR